MASRPLQGEERDLGRAVEAEGDADGADATVDVELQAVEAVEACDILSASWGEDDGAEERQANLATVGVAGKHYVDQAAARVSEDVVGVVGGVAHQQDGAVRLPGDGEVEVGHAGYRVGEAAQPKALPAALDGDVLVDQKRDRDRCQDGADGGRSEDVIVVA